MSDQAATVPATRREELLEIAVKLFAEQGVAKTTVRDIADAAGMLSGSLYHHFSSKNQMVAEAIGNGLMIRTEANRAVIESAPNGAVAMAGLITGAVRWVSQEPDVVKIMTNDKSYIRDNPELVETEKTRQANRIRWIAVIEDGIKDGSFRPIDNVDVLVRAIFDGIFASARWMYGEMAPEQVAAELTEFYLRGLLAEGCHYDFETNELTKTA